MKVVSTSNLVSSETEKTTTACNFKTMAINSFFMSHDERLITILCIHANMKTFAVS